MDRGRGFIVHAFVLVGLALQPAGAQDNDDCLACHGEDWLTVEREGREVSLFVDPDAARASVHGALDCIACHLDLDGVEEYPHEKRLERVECTDCHDDDDGPIAVYRGSRHGQLLELGNPAAPRCQDCHGSHSIAPLKSPESPVAHGNIAETCTRCHVEGARAARILEHPLAPGPDRFPDLIHRTGLVDQGLLVTANCASCHGGHAVLPISTPGSSLHRDSVNRTCGQCHEREAEVHREVIDPERWAQAGALICVDCHAPHGKRKLFLGTNMADRECLSCHAADDLFASQDGRSLHVDLDVHARSVHGRSGLACAQCHSGATASDVRACETIDAPVDCAGCHGQVGTEHRVSQHGKLLAAGDPNAPTCTDCHGTHEVLEHRVPADASEELRQLVLRSPTHRRNVPDLCARCHREGAAAAERYAGSETRIIEHYSMSIHGRALTESGLIVTAICTDCHTAHRELPSSDPESTVHGANIVTTCGQCHDGIYEQFRHSVHSAEANPDHVAEEGAPALPHCNDCHSSHQVTRTDMPDFKLGMTQQCGACHEEITDTYFDTYHGKASELGDSAKAKCYDCHGAHDILPPADPASHLSPTNIVATCGKCHPGAHPRFTQYLTHATHHDRDRNPGLYYAFWGMTTLLVGVFVFFGLHLVAWLPRSWKLRKQYRAELAAIAPEGGKQFRRFNRFERGLHLTVVISFFGLAITGMMLKFAHTPWARALSQVLGGPTTAGWIHRVCALVTFGYIVVHLWDVTRRFRRTDKTAREFLFGEGSLLPKPSDVREFFATLKWFAGRGPMPRYGRWTYWEKFDYFAVFWGVVIIGTTGLCLWFPVLATHLLPGWSLNVATIIHSDEALLATGFIFTIHFFNTHFRPEKFPMDPVIFTGRMRMRELKHDRPRLYEQLVASGELEQHLVDPAPALLSRGVRVFAFSALFLGFTLVVLIVYTMLFMS